MNEDLRKRTKRFSITIIDLVEKLNLSIPQKVISYQLVKSGTSVGANFRAARRARSDKEFVSKLNIVLEEVDESCFWLEIIQEKKWINVDSELKEANELTAIIVTILKKMNDKQNDKN
ncbi:MAG: four helix bundle protein [Flavobacteriia bacterium]|nr:four helix bundle protein [Flavobacteriia bacterium]